MSIFDRFRRKKSPEPQLALAMVLLRSGDQPAVAGAFDYLRSHWQDLPEFTEITSEGPVTTAQIPGGSVNVLHMPGPVPSGDLEGPVAVAWHWPTAAAEVGAHQGHLIVFVSSTTLDPLDLWLLHTKVTAAVVAACDAIGVYVGSAMLVRSAADYLEAALPADRDNPPLLSWVGFNAVNDDGVLSAYTTGLSSFGFLELEAHRVARPFPELLTTMADIAAYQIMSGKNLRDGDTFGASEAERFSVRHAKSEFIPDMKVAVLGLEQTAAGR